MRRGLSAGLLLALSACAPTPEIELRFSRAVAGGELPAQWRPWVVDARKPATRYALVKDGAETVLRAEARQSVSGLINEVQVDPAAQRRMRWRWMGEQLPGGGDERRADADDCVARLVVSFAGDTMRLEPGERAKLALASALSGRAAPYATLMYIWSAKHAPGALIVNPRSSRVRMIVVEQGAARLGRWLDYERDLVDDFRRAFGEEPGMITAVGVLTDADDTQASALAYYGDIALR